MVSGRRIRRTFSSRSIVHVVAAALLLTALNAVKPPHIDDIVYQYYAKQILQHPLAPYDFEIIWNQAPESAQNPIAPPVVPYWLAAGMKLLGPNPVLWKFWFLPIHLLLAGSLFWTFRRFARGLEIPLLWMTILSPVILPGTNLMLDVPCLAIGLTSLAIFLESARLRSIRLALLAGLACGLAMETKWTALLSLAVIVGASVVFFRPREGLIAATVACLVFISWEGFIAVQNGQSHFLHQLKINKPAADKKQLLLALAMILGAVGPMLGLLGLAALKASRRVIWGAGILYAVVFALMIALHATLQGFGPIRTPITGKPWIPKLGTPLFLGAGVGVAVAMAWVCWRLWGHRRGQLLGSPRRDDLFLVGWLLIEFLGYFVFSPFPAVRRVIGLVVVLTVVAGRLASRTNRSPGRLSLIRFTAGFSAVLGLIFYAVDLRDAQSGKEGAEASSRWIRERDPSGRMFYTGDVSFEFHAPLSGFEPMIPDRTTLNAGEWLAIAMTKPDDALRYDLTEADVKLEKIIAVDDAIPLMTLHYYYIGARPIECRDGPRTKVLIYRVARDIRPARVVSHDQHPHYVPIPHKPRSWNDNRIPRTP